MSQRELNVQQLIAGSRGVLRILVVGQTQGEARLIERYLAALVDRRRFDVWSALSGPEALAQVERAPFDVCLFDVQLGEAAILRFLRTVRAWGRDLPVILIAPPGEVDVTVQALTEGARDFLLKGALNPEILLRSIHYATESQRLRQEVERRTAQYESLFHRNLAGSFRLGPDGALLDCNQAFLDLFGLAAREEAASEDLLQLLVPRDWREVDFNGLPASRSSGSRRLRIRTRDGSDRRVCVRTTLLEAVDGRLESIEGTVVEEIERAAAAGRRAPGRAGAWLAEPVSGAVQDLKNLQTTILGYADMLLEEVRSEGPTRQFAREVRIAALRAQGLVNRLLRTRGSASPVRRRLFLGSVVRNLRGMLERLLGDRVELVVEVAPETPPVRVVLPDLERVVTSLVVNARDASPAGGRVTLYGSRAVWPRVEEAGSLDLAPGTYAVLTVSAAGGGMHEGAQAGVLGPESSVQEADQGEGGALGAVREIVTEAGGALRVDSGRGHGATVEVWLPAGDGGAPSPVE